MNPKLAKIRSVLAAKQKRDDHGRFASEGSAIANAANQLETFHVMQKSGQIPAETSKAVGEQLKANLNKRINLLRHAAEERLNQTQRDLDKFKQSGVKDPTGAIQSTLERNVEQSQQDHAHAIQLVKAAMGVGKKPAEKAKEAEEPSQSTHASEPEKAETFEPIDTSDLPRTGVYDKRFRVEHEGNGNVHRKLEEWESFNNLQDYSNHSHLDKASDNASINDAVVSIGRSYPEKLRIVGDDNGRAQAGAIVSDEGDHLYLNYLATAPWNVPGQHDRRTMKGAGSAMIEALVHESMKLGHGGRIRLTALHGAVPFYEKIGFKEMDDSFGFLPHMELTPEAAQQFLHKRKQAHT